MEIKRWLWGLLIGSVLSFVCCYYLLQKEAESKGNEGLNVHLSEESGKTESPEQSHMPENPANLGGGPEVTEPPKEWTIPKRTEGNESMAQEETEVPKESAQPQETEVPWSEIRPMATEEPQVSESPQKTEIPGETREPEETKAPEEFVQPERTVVPDFPPETENPQTPLQTIVPTQPPSFTPTVSPAETGNTLAPVQREEVHVHDFKKSIWELPTCQKGGYYNNICQTCGFVECVTQNPLSHEPEDILIQEGNCMEDTVIRHVCKVCGFQVKSDTRYTEYEKHEWINEMVDGMEMQVCIRCGIAMVCNQE